MSVHIAVGFALGITLTLIVKLFTSAKSNLHLDVASRKIQRKRHDGISLLYHKEIADMLIEKRKREGRETYYRGKVVTPDAHYVDMNKARALKEIKSHVEQIKQEWYGSK